MLGLKPQKVQIDPDDLYNSDFELSYTFLKYLPPKFVKFPYVDHSDDEFRNSSVSSSTCGKDQELSRLRRLIQSCVGTSSTFCILW